MARIDDLPADQQAVLRLLLTQDRSYDEIARSLRMAPAAVRDRAHEALSALAGHAWPGNVRELRNVLERAVVVRGGEPIRAADLGLAGSTPSVPSLDRAHREREALLAALRRTGGKRDEAAQLLGISVRTLYYRLKQWGIG